MIADRQDLFVNYGQLAQGDASQKFRNLKKVYLQKLHKANETVNFDEVKSMRHYQAFCKIYEKERYKANFIVKNEHTIIFCFRLPSVLPFTSGIPSLSFPMDSSPSTDILDDDSDTLHSTIEAPLSISSDLFANQTSLALLFKISSAIENARNEARIHWMNIEAHLNRQNMIENERNQILIEQNKLEKERLEFEREKYEYERSKAQTGTAQLHI